jgi:hypothetical protein
MGLPDSLPRAYQEGLATPEPPQLGGFFALFNAPAAVRRDELCMHRNFAVLE